MSLTTQASSPVQVSIDELLELRQKALSLSLSRKRKVSSHRTGAMQSRVLGRGLDFSELREYQPGDDIRQIDWNVTARTGKAHTKLFTIEKEHPYFVVIDLRASMHFATRTAFKSVIASRLAAILSWMAILTNDRVGGLIFTDTRHIEIKPEGGRRGLIRLFRAITELQKTSDTSGEANPNALSDAVARLARLSHTGSTIWFFSDFSGFDKKCQSQFASLMKHNEVNAIHCVDPLEQKLPPPGVYNLMSVHNSLQIDTRKKQVRQQYKKAFLETQQELQQRFAGARHYYKCVLTDANLDDMAMDILLHRREVGSL